MVSLWRRVSGVGGRRRRSAGHPRPARTGRRCEQGDRLFGPRLSERLGRQGEARPVGELAGAGRQTRRRRPQLAQGGQAVGAADASAGPGAQRRPNSIARRAGRPAAPSQPRKVTASLQFSKAVQRSMYRATQQQRPAQSGPADGQAPAAGRGVNAGVAGRRGAPRPHARRAGPLGQVGAGVAFPQRQAEQDRQR